MSLWTRLGHYPGANLAAALVSGLIAVALIWSFQDALITWAFACGAYAVYCHARPRGGLDAFMAFTCPAGSAWVFHLVTGLPYPALVAILVALALVALMAMDREDGLVPAS
jgi:hypothetical protein